MLADFSTVESPGDFSQSIAYKLLTTDPEARVVINFHGNAGNVAQGWRADTYRALTSLNSRIHVITVDYRGFGESTGSPTEAGITLDGHTLAAYVLDVLKVPADRIVLLGQSLGTAVTSSVALSFADPENTSGLVPAIKKHTNQAQRAPILFKGVVLVASFTNIPQLLKAYRFGGFFPLFSPLNTYPSLQNFLMGCVADTWPSVHRVAAIVRLSWGNTQKGAAGSQPNNVPVRIQFVHAYNDFDIPYTNSEELYYSAVNATTPSGVSRDTIRARRIDRQTPLEKQVQIGLGKLEARTDTWKGDAGDELRLDLVTAGGNGRAPEFRLQNANFYPGHNRVVTYTPTLLAILRAFDLA